MLPRGLVFAACGVAAAIVSCTSFPALDAGVCGNGVVDPGEDCDGYADGAAECRPPGSAGQCRFDCSDADHTCPPGYACGTDSVCRTGTAAFTVGPHVVAPGTNGLNHGDMDGDGRQDLVLETDVDTRVAYFDQPLALAETVSIPVGRSRAVVGFLGVADPPANPIDDLVLTASGGIDVWQGHDDRTVTPLVYPSFPIPGTAHSLIPISINPKVVGTQLVIVSSPVGTGQPNTIYQVDQRETTAPLLLFTNTGAPQDIVGPAVVGHFVEDQTVLPCEQFILAFDTDTAVHVFSPCHQDGTSNAFPTGPLAPPQVLLPDVTPNGGGTITGLLSAELNGDTHADLLIGTTAGLFAAYGIGDGTFNSKALLPVTGSGDGMAGLYPFAVTNDTHDIVSGFPLAAGDLNGDGLSDLVFPAAVVIAQPAANGRYFLSGYDASAPWTSAIIADVNANGFADVVAVSGAEIDFYSGTGTTLLDPTVYATDSNIGSVSVGDVDGDMVSDIVFSQGSLDDDGNTIAGVDDLDVMFGQAAGGYPLDPALIGQLPTITEISVAPFEPTLVSPASVATAIGDIAVLSNDPSNPQQLVAAFVGRPDRELTSPFYLVDGMTEAIQSTFPTRVVGGHFTQTGHGDICAIAGDSDKTPVITGRVWFIPTTGDADVSASAIHGSAYLPVTYDYNAARVVPADLTGAGIDSAIIVVPPASGRRADAGVFMIATPAGIAKQVPLGVGDAVLDTWILKTGDVDANGTVDVGVLYADDSSGTTALAARILWNGHTGDLDPANGTDVPIPSGDALLGFAFGNLDSDPELETLIVTTTGVYYSKVDKTAKTLGAPIQLANVPGASGVTAADYDGDGVIDLALGGTGGADLYRGTPKID